MMISKKYFFYLLPCLLLLCACGDKEIPLSGERLSVLKAQTALMVDEDGKQTLADITLPPVWQNQDWPQAGGYPNRVMSHVGLYSGDLERIWSSSIGEGSDHRHRVVTQPIVANGRIFTADSEGKVTAFDVETGDRLWRVSVLPNDEAPATKSPGLSYGGSYLFVTDGFGNVLALDPITGQRQWYTALEMVTTAPVTISNGQGYVVGLGNETVAFDVETGKILWRHEGAEEFLALIDPLSPTVYENTVYVPTTAGEVYALNKQNGRAAWFENLSSLRQQTGRGLSRLSDLNGHIVVDENILIVGSAGEQIMALDPRSGRRIWQKDLSLISMPWVAGDVVFLVTWNGDLVALNKGNGALFWTENLNSVWAKFDKEDKVEQDIWHGVILAGERLISVSQSGKILALTPKDGQLVFAKDVSEKIPVAPVVAGNTLFLLEDDGTLSAYK